MRKEDSADEDDKDKSSYLSLSQDLDDLRYGYGAKEKTFAGLKLLGKGLFNVAKFTVKEGLPAVNKRLEDQIKEHKERK